MCRTLLVLALAAGTCLAEAPDPALAGAAQTGGPVLHAVHSERLREIMRRLNSLVYEREYTQLELDLMRARQLEALTDAATELARTAEDLGGEAPAAGLDADEQAAFRALALKLYTGSVSLRAEAGDTDIGGMSAAWERLNATCNACHRLFRAR